MDQNDTMTMPTTEAPVPMPALVLGVGGLIPFVTAAFFALFASDLLYAVAPIVLLYGAVILSFLGGIRWGFTVLSARNNGDAWRDYSLSVAPSLLAWTAAFIRGSGGLLLIAVSLVLWYAIERAVPPNLKIPPWYRRLRFILTAVAAGCCALSALRLLG